MRRNPSHRTYERRYKATARVLAKADIEARLFVGTFPCGILYADRAREEGGDYKRLAFLHFRGCQLEFSKGSEQFEAAIRKCAAQYKPGDVIQISSAGQTVRFTADR